MEKINLKIREIIFTDILPMLKEHNGSLVIKKIETIKDDIYIHIDYKGSCDGCSSGQNTIKLISNYIQDELEELFFFKGKVYVIDNPLKFPEIFHDTI